MFLFRLLAFFLLLLPSESITAQNDIINFTRINYNAGSQNWAIEQSKNGVIFVANNEGVLTFNGAKWKLHALPKETIVRSIAFGKDENLYVGGQDEIGYFKPNTSGKLVYVSLVEQIDPKYRQFADIWNIISVEDDVFFRSSSTIFRLHNNRLTAFHAPSRWDFMGLHKSRLIAQDKSAGILEFKENKWQPFVESSPLLAGITITSISSYKSGSLLTTTGKGLLTLNDAVLSPFRISGKGVVNDQFFTTAKTTANGETLIGTYENGLYIIDSLGTLKESIGKGDGLNSSNVRSVLIDRYKHIWLGLEDGISFLHRNNPIKWINPKIFNGAAGYSATIHNSNLYFAMANGIYEMPFSTSNEIPNSENNIQKIKDGLSWKVATIDGRLFAGTDNGLFELKDKRFTAVDQSTGYWIFRKIDSANGSSLFAAGNYLGLTFFSNKNGNYNKETERSYLFTSARYLEYDSATNFIWISHPYRGVYRFSFPANTVKLFTEKEGLPSALNNHVFKVKEKILVATLKGIFVYDHSSQRFKPSVEYDSIFKGISLRYLKEDESGNLWFVHEKKLGFVSNKSNTITYLPELQRRILSGFENVFPVNKNNVLVGSDHGFFLINMNTYLQYNEPLSVFIRNVASTSGGDSVLYDGYGNYSKNSNSRLSHHLNKLHFEYASPFTANSGFFQYSCRLNGFEKDWNIWSEKMEKDYTNIAPGKYTFEVKVRNNLNKESEVVSYTFEILPPWYKTAWARAGFISLFLLLLYRIYRLQAITIHKQQEKKMMEERKKNEEKQQMIMVEHQLELEKSEKELIRIKNEKLEMELASTAMNLVQKKEFLIRIKEEINRLNKQGKETVDTSELKKLLRSLTAEDKLDEEWEQFSIHFNKVHGNFLINLKNKYPELKAHELKLCAYLRMNLSTKEIAQLLSISIRGVEISRYRLRKKLSVPPKEDLFQFLFSQDSGIDSTIHKK